MKLSLVLRRAAQAEFDAAADWYEQQQSNLGRDFVAKVQATFDRIRMNPGQFPIVFEEVRQAIVDRFPFSVLFQVEPKRIVVLAVFHRRRDPSSWKRRVG